MPRLVEADDLAVDDRRAREGGAEPLGDLGEPGLLRLVVAAEEGQVPAVEAGEDAEAVELRLEGPFRPVEGAVDEGAEHRRGLGRHRRRCEFAADFLGRMILDAGPGSAGGHASPIAGRRNAIRIFARQLPCRLACGAVQGGAYPRPWSNPCRGLPRRPGSRGLRLHALAGGGPHRRIHYRVRPRAEPLRDECTGPTNLDVEGTSAVVLLVPDRSMSGLSVAAS